MQMIIKRIDVPVKTEIYDLSYAKAEELSATEKHSPVVRAAVSSQLNAMRMVRDEFGSRKIEKSPVSLELVLYNLASEPNATGKIRSEFLHPEAVLRAVTQTAWERCVQVDTPARVAFARQPFTACALGVQRRMILRAVTRIRPQLRDAGFGMVARALAWVENASPGGVCDLVGGGAVGGRPRPVLGVCRRSRPARSLWALALVFSRAITCR